MDEYNDIFDLMNIYLIYFKKIFNKGNKYNMFSEIDYMDDTSTNRCMELFFEHVHKYKSAIEDDILINKTYINEIGTYKLDEVDELYVLYVNNVKLYECPYLIPIFKYILEQNIKSSDWSITSLKSTY